LRSIRYPLHHGARDVIKQRLLGTMHEFKKAVLDQANVKVRLPRKSG